MVSVSFKIFAPSVTKKMVKYAILLALLFVGGFALPTTNDEGPGFDEDMSIFFDHTVSDVQGRIVGGATAANGAYPWMVAMTNGALRSFVCGGSVIGARRVLTAAHCNVAVMVGNNPSATLRLTVGTNRWNSGGQTYAVTRIINHPSYNPTTIKNDIGALITSANIIMTTLVRAIPVNYDWVAANVPVRVSGWGRIATGGALSQNLLELRMNTIDGARCVSEVARVAAQVNIRAPAVNPNIELCTFLAVNRGTCNGDSGSPLVRNSNNAQVGIVSWGIPCARGAPDMFVRISAFRNWILALP